MRILERFRPWSHSDRCKLGLSESPHQSRDGHRDGEAELTRVETQEIEDAAKGVHVERGFLEIVPSEKGTSVFGGFEPSPEGLEGSL